ncbi:MULTISPECIES: CaiB/BaiF CoA transferase family protein [Pseudonocardia]|uniref:Formyl-coenzyme A transferase n=2 Tax=Pseudonocardia TaxID=1847 RepID=A0A1Y2N030_PSEAH|nr:MULTISPECIES: CoA transferase [Pseudonocardia]OSY40806.1 Formyl-coenzyme A transferase [Pseudonocardia autotrophica]TDN71886.1 crotonobetainyl-CoA:carnitine CoA-transferase CaiB-like acyl-CoA transferase [Pseudonocardia autotrophica]BBG02574.1 CoA transferase [Pseudonocardia autotrophica]GEC24633.1 CoA transferase [Pseudonocardia saturnea]
MTDTVPGPLTGLRVLDLTGTMSGPYCTLLLAQLGASVDKVEPPAGDITRSLMRGRNDTMTPIFLGLNAGKRSIVLDLRTERDRDRLTGLLPRYDAVVHNMRPAAAARIRLTEAGLAAAGSEALLCEIVGYGPGPYEDRPAYDDTTQSISGLAWVQGRGEEPEYVRSAVADKTAGLYAALAVCAALLGRTTGHPSRSVRIPMFETMVAYTTVEQLGGLTFEPPQGPPLYPRTMSPSRRPYRTADGHVGVMLYTDRHWSAFLDWLGREDLAADPSYTTVAGRSLHIDEVYGWLAEQLLGRTTGEWLEIFERLDVPASRVHSFDDLLTDPHLLKAGTVVVEQHPTEGAVRRVRAPFLFDGLPLDDPRPAPTIGEHTTDVLNGP